MTEPRREIIARLARERTRERRDAHQCTYCGAALAPGDRHAMCPECRAKKSAYQRTHYRFSESKPAHGSDVELLLTRAREALRDALHRRELLNEEIRVLRRMAGEKPGEREP